MQHLHFQKIPSTQIYLKDHLKEFSDHEVLISCTEQSEGIGRTGNSWDFYPESLAMSFLLTPHPIPTLTSIEIGLLSVLFFKQKFNQTLFLKWPNDLMTTGQNKCGGIISHYIDASNIVAGLGINFSPPTQTYAYQASHITTPDYVVDKKELSLEIYNYILKNRISFDDKITNLFISHCAHLEQSVTMIDGDQTFQGLFRGIGPRGEALIENNGMTKSFLSGSLLLK